MIIAPPHLVGKTRFGKVSALYLLLSAVSGVGWAGISFIIFGDSLSQSPSIGMLLLMGASSGLLAGCVMSRFYRTNDWVHTLCSAPLALWLGVFFYLAQIGLYNSQNPIVILGAACAACYACFACLISFSPPFFPLLLVALVNGLLLRQILRRPLEGHSALH